MKNYYNTKFFTNVDNANSLLSRFKSSLENAETFDILVGYFRSSGFRDLAGEFKKIKKIRILVGLNVDSTTLQAFNQAKSEQLNFSHQETKEHFSKNLVNEISQSEQTAKTQDSINQFVELLQSKQIELRVVKNRNIHSKLYIIKNNQQTSKSVRGSVITGSSNFSHFGLSAQGEFNVELRDEADLNFAEDQFENLWSDAEELNQVYVEAIKDTWLYEVAPYHLYIKILYEYFKEELETPNIELEDFPEDFTSYEYQLNAVKNAQRILNQHNGVFLADVVGLGKTFMTAMLLKEINLRALVICPPVLIEYWKDVLEKFKVHSKVESSGKLEHLKQQDLSKYKVIIIDEAHRFRNEKTEAYSYLKDICFGKKVVLLSATPFNNRIEDIYNLITLFLPKNNSSLRTIKNGNLEDFFNGFRKKLDKLKKDIAKQEKDITKQAQCLANQKEYKQKLKNSSEEIRQKVLKYLMVRRTRSEILKYYEKDLAEQNLSFPTLETPEKIIYQFNQATEANFNITLAIIQKEIKYSRYSPSNYLKNDQSQFVQQQGINLRGFMKTLQIKRLESSFLAFQETTKRFIESYKKTIKEYENGIVHICKSNASTNIEDISEDEIENLIEQGQSKKSEDFNDNFILDLQFDLRKLEEIAQIWKNYDHKNDPKLKEFLRELENNKILKNQQIIIFTESSETASYLFETINSQANFANQVLKYTSNSYFYKNQSINKQQATDLINQNFNPNSFKQSQDLKILIATDVLSEGVNLHKASIIVNYDLPWNPTKMMQRAGRINRVGSKHKKIYIFNCFPTSESEKAINLEKNILNKLQAFHNALGEDSKYLSELEEISSHGLFEKLTKNLEEGQIEEESELKYLKLIKEIKENQPDLINKIDNLPAKAMGCRNLQGENQPKQDFVITFYKQDKFKRFVCSNQEEEGKEIDFIKAIPFFECQPSEPKLKISNNYFDLLSKNQNCINKEEQPEERHYKTKSKKYTKIENIISFCLSELRGSLQQENSQQENSDYRYLKTIKEKLNDLLTDKTAKKIITKISNIPNKGDISQNIKTLKEFFKPEQIINNQNQNILQKQPLTKEIILSQYFKPTKF